MTKLTDDSKSSERQHAPPPGAREAAVNFTRKRGYKPTRARRIVNGGRDLQPHKKRRIDLRIAARKAGLEVRGEDVDFL